MLSLVWARKYRISRNDGALHVSIDYRDATSYALWRVAGEGYMAMAASDFWTNWKPDESLLERLVGSTPVTVSAPAPDQRG
jgi:hypothetical protein